MRKYIFGYALIRKAGSALKSELQHAHYIDHALKNECAKFDYFIKALISKSQEFSLLMACSKNRVFAYKACDKKSYPISCDTVL
jgi:hypothetical protein